MKLIIDTKDLANQMKDPSKLKDLAVDIREILKDKLTPSSGGGTGSATGLLKATMKEQVVGNEIQIWMKDYWKYLEYGTHPHTILPVTAKALHWKDSSGKSVFAKVVHHPGTMEHAFVRTTVYQDIPELLKKYF